MYPEPTVQFLIQNGRDWVVSQRSVRRPAARVLTEPERAAFGGFYAPAILDLARVASVGLIENPDFYDFLVRQGFPIPLDFRQMSGITFIDVVVTASLSSPTSSEFLSLLFHELVHVVQYQKLGLDRFIERYVRGWLENGLEYPRIPIETHAYELQMRYESDPSATFSVDAEVSARSGSY